MGGRRWGGGGSGVGRGVGDGIGRRGVEEMKGWGWGGVGAVLPLNSGLGGSVGVDGT